ncbi:MAG TPA: ion channel [Solirubrobacteraceae bacterium]|nr:ion channel [Solirubrobacteraceae bacterium]
MASAEDREAGYRFGLVFLLTFTLAVFVIVAPTVSWSRAVGLGLQWLALLTVIATSRTRMNVRRPEAVLVVALMSFTVVGAASGTLSRPLLFAVSGLLSALTPVALIGGLLRLVRERGVTLQAVAGALTLYLLVGLVFAWTIGFVDEVESVPYFVQAAKPSTSQIAYFSFTAMTTTGFGDLTAATKVGRALTVVEMLIGQLYLVTVIGVLVGNFAGRGRRAAGGRVAETATPPPG